MPCNTTCSDDHSITSLYYAKGRISDIFMHVTKSITIIHTGRHKNQNSIMQKNEYSNILNMVC